MSRKHKNRKDSATKSTALQQKGTPHFEATPLRFLDRGETLDGKLIQSNSDYPNPIDALQKIAGVGDTDLSTNILLASSAAMSSWFNQSTADKANLIAQSLNDYQPKDAMEARLAVQATAVFSHAIKSLILAESASHLPAKESYINMAVKLMRVHNETVETLNRYRRGGEQKVTVTHAVIAQQAVVNQYTSGGGVSQKNQGDTPCQQYAEPEPEETILSHAVNPQWPMEDADCMEGTVVERKRKRVNGG